MSFENYDGKQDQAVEESKLAREQEGSSILRHIPALYGLRGVAVAGVLLFHAGHLVDGYLGVDLFFVLSGF